MTGKKRVLFVVLNFNGWRETIPCVESIMAQTYSDFRLMVIDNGSADESLHKLEYLKKNDKVIFHEEPVNTGFAGGVNIGIRYALTNDYPFVVLLNNDAIITPKWLETLMNTMQKTGATSVNGLLLSGDGKKIESTGDACSIWCLPFPRQRDEKTSAACDSGFVFGGTAGASLYAAEFFQDVGLFDERFFAYFEDTDINFRAQLAGHKAYYEKTAVAYHDHNTTSKKMPGFTVYQTFKNLPMVFWKNIPTSMLLTSGVRFFAAYGLMYVRAILRGQFVIATRGMLRGLWYFPGVLADRIRIQRNKRVSTSVIRAMLYPELPPNNKRNARRIFHR